MKFYNLSLLAALAFACASTASAIPFNTTTVGGTATVGTGGDYATLADAATGFNGLASPFLQGNWKLEILNDLTEPANVGFANTIPPGSSLTMKPAASTSSTLTFSATIDNNGPSGNLLIGCFNPAAFSNLKPTNSFVIDGSNNGTESKNLTITNTTGANHTFSCPLVVVGDSDDVTFKNLTVINKSTNTGSSIAGISAVMRGETTVAFTPDRFTVRNCDIFVPASQGHGLLFRASGTLPANVAGMLDFEVSNCLIEGHIRTIFLDAGMDGSITSNTLRNGAIGAAVNGFLQLGIGVNNARFAPNQVLDITSNTLFMQSANVSSGNYGVIAVDIASVAPSNVVNVVNNMVNYRFTSAATAQGKGMQYAGIRATTSSATTFNIIHNSINMPNFANLDSLDPITSSVYAIKLPSTINYVGNIQNNILRLDQAKMAGIGIQKSAAVTGPIVSNNNVIFRSRTNTYTGVGGTNTAPTLYLTLGDWQAGTGQDAASVSVDPTATAGSSWQPSPVDANLHFVPATAKPTGIPLMPFLAAAPVDIDGEARPLSGGVLPGADEVVLNAAVGEWNLY